MNLNVTKIRARELTLSRKLRFRIQSIFLFITFVLTPIILVDSYQNILFAIFSLTILSLLTFRYGYFGIRFTGSLVVAGFIYYQSDINLESHSFLESFLKSEFIKAIILFAFVANLVFIIRELEEGETFTIKPFSIFVAVAGLIAAPSAIYSNEIHKLASFFSRYDLVVHLFIPRALAECQTSLSSCDKFEIGEHINNYPNAFHSLFAIFLKEQSYQLSDGFYAYTTVIFFAVLLPNLIVYRALIYMTKMINKHGVVSKSSLKSFFKWQSFAILIFSNFGVTTIVNQFGYLNFSFALAFFTFGFYAFLKGNLIESGIFLVASSIIWSFIFLLIPFILILICYRSRHRTCHTILLICFALLAYVDFVNGALSSNQTEATFVLSNRFLEPLASMLFLMIIWKFMGLYLTKNSSVMVFLLSIFLPLVIFWVIGLLNGVWMSYYLYKASHALLIIEFGFLLCSLSFITSRRVITGARVVLDKTYFKRLKIASALAIMPLIFTFFNWIPWSYISSGRFGNWNATSSLYATWFPSERDLMSARAVLGAKEFTKAGQEALLQSNIYWYRDTQWLNMLNNSWTYDLQVTIDGFITDKTTYSSITDRKISKSSFDVISAHCDADNIYFDFCLRK